MALTGALDTIRRERASFAREVEYLKESVVDDYLDDRMESAERSKGVVDSLEDFKEAAYICNCMPAEEGTIEDEELTRILESTEDITFEEMIGIEE